MAEQLEPEPAPSAAVGFVSRLSSYVANALRYWEPRPAVYNGVLAVVVLTHFVLGLPGSWAKISFDVLLGLFFLAVLANVCYCAAYLADLFVQFSGLHAAWGWGRVALLTVGTAFAATITHFFAKGVFGA